MEIMEPAKAARIIPADPTELPLPSETIITRDTTSFAPDEIPSTKGPAMGFAKNVWSRNPDTDSAPPSITADKIRGRRISHTMRYEAASPVLLNRISPISSTDRCTLPELMFQINKKHIMTARRANEILFFI